MNLKESFRYQKFLNEMLGLAHFSITSYSHSMETTKIHHRNKTNPDAEDITEVVKPDTAFYPNDDVVDFMVWLVSEKEKLTRAISTAKAEAEIDIDAAVETNKFRQSVNSAIKKMSKYTPAKTVEKGTDYKFNNEGNQVPYYYDIEVVSNEAYDKGKAKKVMRSMISAADETSAKIDSVMINTVVDYTPIFDVNESFDDVMEEFIKGNIVTK